MIKSSARRQNARRFVIRFADASPLHLYTRCIFRRRFATAAAEMRALTCC